MKETLAELTAAQFIDLVCGDASVLLGKHEIPNPIMLATITRNIVVEYKSIADPAAMRAFLTRTENTLKALIGLLVLTMANTLISLNAIDKAKDVLTEYGHPVSTMSEKRLKREVSTQMARIKRVLESLSESDDKAPESSDIRNAFDKQTAAMMAHFKFQIDTVSIPATLYAHLVERFLAEMKAQKEAMRK